MAWVSLAPSRPGRSHLDLKVLAVVPAVVVAVAVVVVVVVVVVEPLHSVKQICSAGFLSLQS